jgi:WD40 repeat protein
VFRVTVPKDFGKKELVWTLTTKGQTEKAYGTLIPEYIIDSQLAMLDVGNFGRDPEGKELLNKAPTLQLEGPTERRIAVGQPLSLSATAGDDGLIKLWKPGEAQPLRTFTHRNAVRGLAFAHDGRTLFAGDRERTLAAGLANGFCRQEY